MRGYDYYNAYDNSYRSRSIYEIANSYLQREYVGYRFIDEQLTPISDDYELEAVKQALNNPYSPVYEHLSKANKLLGDRTAPDYEKQDYENEFGTKPLGEFVREIVGLDMNAAKEAFSEYLTNTSLNSRQIYFVNQIVEYIVHNGMLKDFSVLQESPFTDQGSVVEIFTDISVWLGIKKVIDTINANAVA